MTTIKSFTDLSQSKKLAEILPLESADMHYARIKDDYKLRNWEVYLSSIPNYAIFFEYLPCWSLAALLEALPKIVNHETLFIETSAALWHIGYRNIYTARADNLVDACYEMIIKLHELKML